MTLLFGTKSGKGKLILVQGLSTWAQLTFGGRSFSVVGLSWAFRMFSSIPNLYPPDARSIQKCFQVPPKTTLPLLDENHHFAASGTCGKAALKLLCSSVSLNPVW